MQQVLNVYAGTRALQILKTVGFQSNLFHTVLGASGGPKWFVLAGIDRVLITEFFSGRQEPVNLVGSSAGAFRFACLSQPDPVGAINRLATEYSETVYSDKPTIDEVSDKAMDLLQRMLPIENRQKMAQNKIFVPHLIAARCRGILAPENKAIQFPGLAISALANSISRKQLGKFYERFVFSGTQQNLYFDDPAQLPTKHVSLSENNVIDALLASGAIPGILRGIEDIDGAGKGMFRDGGVTDYHFDLKFTGNTRPGDNTADKVNNSANKVDNDLVLFPHFFPVPKPGWFDKSLPWRHPHRSSYENIVMIVPSKEFVASLPYGKIPDRHDFAKISAEERVPYWQKVLQETDRLGEAFLALQNRENLDKVLAPLPFKTV